jgi:hypothetical protein
MRGLLGVVLFCWGIFSALSLLSELHFLVDGLNWSIRHWDFSFEAVLLEIGRQISEAVSGYRALIRGLVALLHLPVLPHYVYDGLGIICFSLRWGTRQYRYDKAAADYSNQIPKTSEWLEFFPYPYTPGPFDLIEYAAKASVVLFVLFGIDYVYRHFA